MGMDVSAKLMYGVSYDDLIDLEDLDDLLDDGDLDYAAPYYDAPRDEWFVGVEVDDYQEGESAMVSAIRKAKLRFERKVGARRATIKACANVY